MVDDFIDTAITLAVVAMLVGFTVQYGITPMVKGFGGFETKLEKTALVNKGEVHPEEIPITVNDITLCLSVADEYTPKPNKLVFIKPDGTKVSFSGVIIEPGKPADILDLCYYGFRANRISTIAALKANWGLSNSTKVKITPKVGTDKLEYWEVEEDA